MGSCGDASEGSGEPLERFGEALVKLWAGFGDDLGGFGETLGKLRGGNEVFAKKARVQRAL